MKLSKLILISVACLIFYRLRKSHPDLQQKTNPAESDKKRELDLIRQYAADKQVRYISIVNKIYFAKDKAGQPVSWRHPLGISMSALPANEYFQLGRGCIVHRSIISVLESEPAEYKLCVFLADPFTGRFDLPANKIEAFKFWWSQGGAY